ncbi:MAG TPA: DUF1272 domain-containing protein [Gammaproteobacteria bacterium]|nr:DUF1272 domain-containing protein [Gammaproteobacteria bacterium]
MLEMRPNCECCDRDLPPDSIEAMICTFECTFCRDCVEQRLHGVCPNCGGGFAPRPVCPASLLEKYPTSEKRITNPLCQEHHADVA